MFQLVLVLLAAFQQPAPQGAPAPRKIEAPKELIQAAEKGELDRIRGLSQHSGFVGTDGNGRTALLAAGEKGQKAAFTEIMTIINARAKKEAGRIRVEGQDAVADLMAAVRARMLFYNTADKKGMTPLMHAAREGWDDIVALLLDGGATTTTLDKNSRTAADYADKAGHRALADTLRTPPK